jgi:hypothetical protein
MGANAQTSVPKFTAAQVLTASHQNLSAATGVPVFATTVTRDAAFGGSNKALAEGQLCYIEASDIVQYYSGASWATVGPATAGGIELISTTTFSGSSVTLSSIPQTYKNLYMVIRNFLPSGDNEGYWLRVNSDATASRHLSTNLLTLSGTAFNETAWKNTAGFDNAATQHTAIINMYDYTNTATWKMGSWLQVGNNATTSTSVNLNAGYGIYNQTAAVTSFQFIPTGGTFTSGTVYLYGVN